MSSENVKKQISDNRVKTIAFVLSSLLGGFALTYKITEAIPFWAYGRVTQDFLIARLYSLFGDFQFDMIISALLCGCMIKLVSDKFASYIKGYFLPVFFSVIIVLGRSAAEFGDLTGAFGAFSSLIRAVLAIAGFAVIFRYVFALAEAGWERLSRINNVPKVLEGFFGKHIFRNVFLLLMILWLPVMILNYPGNHNSDFIGQLLQNTGELPYSTHHPIVLTWIIGLFFGLFKHLTGSYDQALFIWILLQSAALSAALSLTLGELKKRGASYGILTAIMSVYVFSPIYSNIATTAIKDVFFAAACIWYMVLTVKFYDDEDAFLKSPANIIKICVAAFFVCACRNNGSIIVFVNGIVMSVCALGSKDSKGAPGYKGCAKKALLFVILPLCVYTAFSSGIKAAKNAESDGLKEMMSIPVRQTALYLTRYEDELTAEEISSINALFGNYEYMIDHYDPTISDTVKQFYDTGASDEVVTGYIKTWAGMFFKHPGTYFESFFLSSYGWFDPETDTSVRYEGDSDLFSRAGLFEGADQMLVFFYRYLDRISVLGLLQSPGLWTMIMFILIRKNKKDTRLYAMQLITLLVCMASPCFLNHARYAFPIMFTIPFMSGYEFSKKDERN